MCWQELNLWFYLCLAVIQNFQISAPVNFNVTHWCNLHYWMVPSILFILCLCTSTLIVNGLLNSWYMTTESSWPFIQILFVNVLSLWLKMHKRQLQNLYLEIFVHLLTLAVVRCCRTVRQPRCKLLQVVALHSVIFSVAARMASDVHPLLVSAMSMGEGSCLRKKKKKRKRSLYSYE